MSDGDIMPCLASVLESSDSAIDDPEDRGFWSDSDSMPELGFVSESSDDEVGQSDDSWPDVEIVPNSTTSGGGRNGYCLSDSDTMPCLASVSDSSDSAIDDSEDRVFWSDNDSTPALVSVSEFSDDEVDHSDDSSPNFEFVADSTSSEVDLLENWLPRPSAPYYNPSIKYTSLHGGGNASVDDSVSSGPIDVSDYDSDHMNIDRSDFIKEDWIGCGKLWEDKMPAIVCRARNRSRAIPAGVRNLFIPNSGLSVDELLSVEDVIHSTTETAKFNTEPPNCLNGDPAGEEFQQQLRHRRQFISNAAKDSSLLRRTFDDSWLSGAQSIRLAGDPLTRYPLWMERLLGDLEISMRKERAWRRSADWISSVSSCALDETTEELILECRSRFHDIPWNATVPGLGKAVQLSTEDLTGFLSDDWINDDMINAGSEFVSRQLGSNCRTRILNVLFIESLKNLRSTQAIYFPRRLSRMDQSIQDGEIDRLFVPVHINGNHWTLLRLDVNTRHYAYGDSMNTSTSVPPDILDTLVWWIDTLQPGQPGWRPAFTISPIPLIIPAQRDTFSCGIVVLSTIAKYLLDFPPWSQSTYACERMQWFLRLSEPFHSTNEVSLFLSAL